MWHYFGGSDYARGGTGDPRSRRSGDDFALATARAQEAGPIQFVNVWRYTGIEANQAAAMIHRHDQAFQYSLLVMDPNGGGLEVRDDLRKPIQNDGASQFAVTPMITEWDEQLAGAGNPKLVLFKRGEPIMDRCGFIFPSESHLVNKLHDLFRRGLMNGEVQAPPPWAGWPRGGRGSGNVDQMRLWLNEQVGMQPHERAAAEIDLAFLQLISVGQKADKEGKPLLDKYNQFTFVSRRKKDAAYALIYCYFGIHLWRTLQSLQEKEDPDAEFSAFGQEV
ncbi:MAG: hypothetical protein KIS92_02755 [Planctomycetota bacterium]|nr:hypothetical protein [Planctomycetota bacterium]